MTEFLLETILLALALSIDSFAAGFAYGIDRVRIPPASVFILSLISCLTLAVSLSAGHLVCRFLPEPLTADLGFLILLVLGTVKLFDRSCKKQTDRANKDHDSCLSASEAVSLGIALSIDSAAAGLGAGALPVWFVPALAAVFVTGTAAILGGSFLGQTLSRRTHMELGWLGGVLLIILAFFRLR